MKPPLSLAVLVCAAVLALGSCKKDEEGYVRGVQYEATCDTCQVSYMIGNTKIFTVVHGNWHHFFRIYSQQYLAVEVIDSDSNGTSTAKVIVNNELRYSARNTGALDTAVIAQGYP